MKNFSMAGVLFFLSVSVSAHAYIGCGETQGTVPDKIADCFKKNGEAAKKDLWVLVQQSSEKPEHQWWKDLDTGLIWTPKYPQSCTAGRCQGFDFKMAKEKCVADGGKLPSFEEMVHLNYRGAKLVLPEFDDNYWAQSNMIKQKIAWFVGYSRGMLMNINPMAVDSRFIAAVRCVAQHD